GWSTASVRVPVRCEPGRLLRLKNRDFPFTAFSPNPETMASVNHEASGIGRFLTQRRQKAARWA
ncbi:MAG: hypothetical protein ACPHF4_07090, partial [Rubripirellula sp.]